MKKSTGKTTIEELAAQEGISAEEIRKEIEKAIDAALSSTSPAVQAYWAAIPKAGEKHTPEEVIEYIVEEMLSM